MLILRAATAALAGGLVVATLAGCESAADLVDPGPDPRDAATVLADALASGDLGQVPVTADSPGDRSDDVQASYDAVVENLVGGPVDGLAPTVRVEDVTEGEPTSDGRDTATATLSWAWPVAPARDDDGRWSYSSSADLVLDDDTWQVAWERSVIEPSLGPGTTLDLSTLPARRGTVRGAGDVAIVAERQVTRVGLDKTQVGEARAGASARALARAADIAPGPFAQQVAAAGDQAFVEAIVYRSEELPGALIGAAEAIKGARLIAAQVPLAPTRGFAAPLLGSVGPVTAEMVEDDPDRYRSGDTAGLSGLQARYDDDLRGVDGLLVSAVGPDGRQRRLARVKPQAGTPLRLTLDERLQQEAESALADLAPDGALVALRPSDGAILAAANGPDLGGLNIATFGQVPPGSTFKIASSLALLRTGLTPASTVTCDPAVVVDGKRFENYDGYPADRLGDIPLRSAIAQSCNTALISARDRLAEGDLADAAATLGLGIDHDLGFPAYFGQVEPPASETQAAADMIGQGKVLASPLTMASVIGTVQSGELVVPRLIEGDLAPPQETQDAAPLRGREADQLREMLRAVVTEGSGSLLSDLPGGPVIAKTGTAEFDGDRGLQTHAWMVGAQGDVAVAVFVRVGDSGSGVAGPVLERFLRVAQAG